MTLISDPSPEFPNNTNASFKVRLQTPLDVRNPKWEVALVSLSIPNRGVDMKDLGYTSSADVVLKVIMFVWDRLGGNERITVTVQAGDLFENIHHVVTSGIELWVRLSNVLHDKIEYAMTELAKKYTRWYQCFEDERPTIEVDPIKQTVKIVMHPNTRYGPIMSLDEKFAKAYGMVHFDEAANKFLRNPDVLRASLPPFVDKGRTVFRQGDTSGQSFMNYRRPFIELSGAVNWSVYNIDRQFKEISSTNARSILVYSDIVQSTVMGPQRHHLLRELFIPHEEHDERQMVEPVHYQWVPIARMRTEIVEVELADLNGQLLKLPRGKTVVTLSVRPTER